MTRARLGRLERTESRERVGGGGSSRAGPGVGAEGALAAGRGVESAGERGVRGAGAPRRPQVRREARLGGIAS